VSERINSVRSVLVGKWVLNGQVSPASRIRAALLACTAGLGLFVCFGFGSAQASSFCQIAGSSKAASLLGTKTSLLSTTTGCVFSVGLGNMEINEFTSAKQLHNFVLLVNPKTKIVTIKVPSGVSPGDTNRHFVRIDGVATVFWSSTAVKSAPEANYYAMKDRRVFEVVVSGVALPSKVAESAMRIIIKSA
jgi:hypothetical protein